MTLDIVLDVDGTLDDFHGDVTPKLCKDLAAKGARLWMLSKREEGLLKEQAISSKYGLTPIIVVQGDNYVHTKVGSLKTWMQEVPQKEKVVYVGDRAEDFMIAWFCNCIYCSPSALSLEIFDEVKYSIGIMCGGQNGKKAFFRVNLVKPSLGAIL